MSEPDNIPDGLRDLIDDYLAGVLDEERLSELDGLLRGNADARRYFVRYCRLHTDLYREVRARQAGERVLQEIFPEAPRSALRSPRLLAAAVLLLAVGAGVWWVGARRPEVTTTPEVAWLVNAQDCRWADGMEPSGPMHTGTVLRVERGLAEVRFRSGARVLLNGPARLELLSANSARLLSGRLTARVPGPAIGFTLLAPGGKVVDLGTEFGVSVANDGKTDVCVFDGQVEASAAKKSAVRVEKGQAARLSDDRVTLRPSDPKTDDARFVRAIIPPAVATVRKYDFRRAAPGSILDKNGRGIGLTHRLPGTGRRLPPSDPNLRLDVEKGHLELNTTKSDINTQYQLDQGEYLGVRLADLGLTGGEDFAVTVTIPNIPALKRVGQFGLYAGAHSDRVIRGGLISIDDKGKYRLNLVNNHGGRDSDSIFVDLHDAGTDVRITLRRQAGQYSLTVENLTTGGSGTLAIRHPAFLDGEKDLYVGLFGANTQSELRRTLVIKDFQVTVWTTAPR